MVVVEGGIFCFDGEIPVHVLGISREVTSTLESLSVGDVCFAETASSSIRASSSKTGDDKHFFFLPRCTRAVAGVFMVGKAILGEL